MSERLGLYALKERVKRARRYDGVVPNELNGVGQLEGVEKEGRKRVGKGGKKVEMKVMV
jgi:hypothetical protein